MSGNLTMTDRTQHDMTQPTTDIDRADPFALDEPLWQEWISALEYADRHDVSERTVKRWLADDLIPGARKNRRGRWEIPADANRPDVADIPKPSTAVARVPGSPYASMPSFLSIDEASELLGISKHAIRKHPDYFATVPFGANGALVVPLATIREIRGE